MATRNDNTNEAVNKATDTRRWIPFAERRGLEDMTLGPTAYPAAKVKGDRSMPSKRERSEDADDPPHSRKARAIR